MTAPVVDRVAASSTAVAVALAAVGALVGGVVLVAELLRPSGTLTDVDRAAIEMVAHDPREPVRCVTDRPREGQDRPGTAAPTRFVADVTSAELLDCPQTWDGRRVRVRAEVVGPVLVRAGGAWVRLNDDVYGTEADPLPGHRTYQGLNRGIGAVLPRRLMGAVATIGGPGSSGDVVEVEGVFHRVDPATGEVAVLRVDAGTVTGVGGAVAGLSATDGRETAALVLVPVAATVVVLERRWARRR